MGWSVKKTSSQIADSVSHEPVLIPGSLLDRAQQSEPEILRADIVVVLVLVLVALAIRLPVLLATGFGIESDEAIVGLMAKHILAHDKPWPIFYYGQAYMGSLEPFLVALSFRLFGQMNESLKLVPLCFSLVQVALAYVLAFRVGNRRIAFLAALLTAICPSALTIWSSKARGGFIELVVLGSLALMQAVRILETDTRTSARTLWGFGILLGLAWWVNNQAIFYIASIGLVFLWKGAAERQWKETFRIGLLTGYGFVLGSLPFWIYNLSSEPKFETLRMLARPSQSGSTLAHLQGLFSVALPILFGARGLWQERDLFSGASIISLGIVFVLLALATARTSLRSHGASNQSPWGVRLLFAMLLLTPTIFCLSSFGWLSAEPRYLLPLYSVLFVLVAIGIDCLLESRRLKFLGVGSLALLLGIHLWSNFPNGEIATPGEPFVENGERVSRNHFPLYQWLKSRNYKHVNTSYWIGYRLAFETNESVTFSLIGRDAVVRIPEYEHEGPFEAVTDPFVLVPSQARALRVALKNQGFSFTENQVQNYVILDAIRPNVNVSRPIPLTLDEISLPSRKEWGRNLIDGDRGTRWGSGMPQAPGMTLGVEFPTPVRLAGLDMDLGTWPQDVSRGLKIEAEDEDGKVETLFASSGPLLRFNGSSTVMIRFDAKSPVRRLRLIQTGSDPVFDWSIAELAVYARD